MLKQTIVDGDVLRIDAPETALNVVAVYSNGAFVCELVVKDGEITYHLGFCCENNRMKMPCRSCRARLATSPKDAKHR